MINLIPPSARKGIVREYWVRVLTVWLLLFGTGVFIVAVLLLPTFMLIHGQVTTLGEQMSDTAGMATTFDSSAAQLQAASEQAALLMQVASTTSFSAYAAVIERLAGTDVKLQTISFTHTPTGGTFKLSGVADTRQTLASFRDALEADAYFREVVLPISALIKDKDLIFSIDLSVSSSSQTTP